MRNIDSQADSIGLGLRAAVDTAAEAATLRGAAATTGKKPACGPRRVEDFIDGAATERRGRTPAGRGTFERDYEPVRRLLMFDGEAPGAVASLDESPAGGAADEDPRRQRCGGVRLVLSLRLDDTDSNVLCDLRLASSVDVLADALADLSVADDARRGSSSVAYDAAASDAGWSLIARMEHLRIRPLTPAAQKLSYVGYWALLLEHMASRGMRTITPAAVRAWLLREAGDLVARLVEAHGAPFPDLQVDHIVAHKWGGVDHPYNYFIMHRSANTSFNSDGACEESRPHATGGAANQSARLTRRGRVLQLLTRRGRVLQLLTRRACVCCAHAVSDAREGGALYGARRRQGGEGLLRLGAQRLRRQLRRLPAAHDDAHALELNDCAACRHIAPRTRNVQPLHAWFSQRKPSVALPQVTSMGHCSEAAVR